MKKLRAILLLIFYAIYGTGSEDIHHFLYCRKFMERLGDILLLRFAVFYEDILGCRLSTWRRVLNLLLTFFKKT